MTTDGTHIRTQEEKSMKTHSSEEIQGRLTESVQNHSSEVLRELALTLYQCPGNGGIVTNPADCRPSTGVLPSLSLENLGKGN